MGLITAALAFGAGYTLGKPEGREQVRSYLQQAREQARTPEAARLRKRGQEVVADRLRAVTRRADSGRTVDDTLPAERSRPRSPGRGWRRPRPTPGVVDPAGVPASTSTSDAVGTATAVPAATPTTAPAENDAAGFGGSTVAEDSHAAILGLDSPSPTARPGAPLPPPADS